MEKRSLVAIVLTVLILIGYQELITRLYPPPPPSGSQEQYQAEPENHAPSIPQQKSETPAPVSPPSPAASAPPVATSQTEREITVDNDVYTAIFSSRGARLKSFRLKHYPEENGPDSPPLEMIEAGENGQLPLEVRIEDKGTLISDDSIPYEVMGGNLALHGAEQATLEFRGKASNGALFMKKFSFSGDTYGIGLEVTVAAPVQTPATLSLVWAHAFDPHYSSSHGESGPVALIGRKFIYETNSSVKEEAKQWGPDRIRWAGYSETYFVSAILPPEGERNSLLFRVDEGTVETKVSIPWSGEPVSYTVYVGPKKSSALNAVHPSLDRAIDFGWFHFIARPLVSLLQFSHSVTGNYGIDIILLTILVKLIFFPLSVKSFKSMDDLKKVQPQMERIREQYKDDREKMNREMMELYRRHKINPLGGCLPMLVQLPVFIGLYQAFLQAIELRQAPFFGWIHDLSLPDRLGTLHIPFIDPPGIPVLTILMGGTMVVQQAMMPAPGDPMQQKIMMLMPIIFTIMFVNFPSGLVLYWLVNNVLSIAQQYAYNKGLV